MVRLWVRIKNFFVHYFNRCVIFVVLNNFIKSVSLKKSSVYAVQTLAFLMLTTDF